MILLKIDFSREQAENLRQEYFSSNLNIRGPNYDAFNPYSHQQIAFLYSSFLKKTGSTLCIGPLSVVWKFFGTQDLPLGTFLTK